MARHGIVVATLGLLTLSTPASLAGQLIIDYFGLADVAESPGYAVLVRVDRTDTNASKLWGTVERVWQKKPRRAVLGQLGKPGEVGAAVELDIFPGVKWTNPRASPIEPRLHNAIRLTEVQIGDRVVVAREQIVPGDPGTLRKLDIYFDARGVKGYASSAKTEQLLADLGDADLWQVAYDTLASRRKLTNLAVMTVAPPFRNRLLHHHTKEMAAKARRAFLRDAHAYLTTTKDVDLHAFVLNNLYDDIHPSFLRELADLVYVIPPADDNQSEDRDRTRQGLVEFAQARGGFEHLVDLTVTGQQHRRPGIVGDDTVAVVLDGLDAKQRQAAVHRLFGTLGDTSTTRRKGAAIDLQLLESITGVVADHPSAAHVADIRAVDLSLETDRDRRRRSGNCLLKMLVAIAAKDAKSKPQVKSAGEALLSLKVPVAKDGATVAVGLRDELDFRVVREFDDLFEED